MSSLAEQHCEPCRGGMPPMDRDAIEALLPQLDPRWEVVEDHHLRRAYRFKDFASALAFTQTVGAIAEAQGHHPEITLGWGKVELEIWTHKIDGLHLADFILAARCEEAAEEAAGRLEDPPGAPS